MTVETFPVNDTDITHAQALSQTYVLQLKMWVLFLFEEHIFLFFVCVCVCIVHRASYYNLCK